jgi:hypothetical protein
MLQKRNLLSSLTNHRVKDKMEAEAQNLGEARVNQVPPAETPS